MCATSSFDFFADSFDVGDMEELQFQVQSWIHHLKPECYAPCHYYSSPQFSLEVPVSRNKHKENQTKYLVFVTLF